MQMKKIIRNVEKVLVPVAKSIVESDQQHAPIFFIGKDDALVPILIPMKNEQEKDAVVHAIRSACKNADADFCIFINESWYVARPDGAKVENVRPSKCKDKQEALVFCINKPKGEHASLMLPFKRVKGKVEFGKMQKGSQSLGGRFVFTW